jgi:hypothetical protein
MPHQVPHDGENSVCTRFRVGGWGCLSPASFFIYGMMPGASGQPHGTGTRDVRLWENRILTVYSMYIKRM